MNHDAHLNKISGTNSGIFPIFLDLQNQELHTRVIGPVFFVTYRYIDTKKVFFTEKDSLSFDENYRVKAASSPNINKGIL